MSRGFSSLMCAEFGRMVCGRVVRQHCASVEWQCLAVLDMSAGDPVLSGVLRVLGVTRQRHNRLALVCGSCTPARSSLMHLRDHRQAGLSDPSCPQASAPIGECGAAPLKGAISSLTAETGCRTGRRPAAPLTSFGLWTALCHRQSPSICSRTSRSMGFLFPWDYEYRDINLFIQDFLNGNCAFVPSYDYNVRYFLKKIRK